MKPIIQTVIALAVTLSSTGCVVGMSANNQPTPLLMSSPRYVEQTVDPNRVSRLFTLRKVTINGSIVSLDIDSGRAINTGLESFINKHLKGRFTRTGVCELPELRNPFTVVTLHLYDRGELKHTTNRTAAYLCGR